MQGGGIMNDEVKQGSVREGNQQFLPTFPSNHYHFSQTMEDFFLKFRILIQ